ncbi:uncharacterized protein LOC112157707 [Oryzias melastigma]|uniref:Photoreceptor cilium actin regulator 2 n=1 Tax=Oryzias melastigma TaxID=30732 RepID=A0A3B3B793_ORYME|nr:uncharacterized protein LOC112157707 [Oryzias melastigma]
MGCSPSKGKLFSKTDGQGHQRDLPTDAPQDLLESKPAQEQEPCLIRTEETEKELPVPDEDDTTREMTPNPAVESTGDVTEAQVDLKPQEIPDEVIQTNNTRNIEKQKKNKSKRFSEKQRKSSAIHRKVDFPSHMVRAHQAAYSFLNPNISKYETLLGLLDQAAQTQLSLQPMMSALVLRFEEINQALEEMAEEGELMIKEHGDCMALPSGMKGQAVSVAGSDSTTPFDPHPDLLQQMLHQSAEKMRLVGGSVQALGDTTLEEAVEYFSSLSKLLLQKLLAKRAAERRLAQVLARVEGAAMRKFNPEDCALQSEDSGIGGENESLTGSERHRRHRGSAGSGSCGSGGNIRIALDSISCSLSNQVGNIDDEDEEDDDEFEDDENDRPERKRSNSSPPDPSQALRYVYANSMRNLQHAGKSPLTAVKSEQSSSTSSENPTPDLEEKIKETSETKGRKSSPGPSSNLIRSGFRRHSINGPGGKSPVRSLHCSIPVLGSQPPRRRCVRRLINTFSQGVDGRPGQSLANIPPHLRRPNKSRILLLSGAVNSNEGGVNSTGSSWPDSRDDLDVDSLPPPPPEVLMDNSFQSTTGRLRNEQSQESSVRVLPMINQKSGTSQRLKIHMHNVEVLPNKVNVKSESTSTSPAQLFGQGADQETEPGSAKIACDTPETLKMIAEPNCMEPSPPRDRMDQNLDSNESDQSSNTLPVRAPPVSRVRLPPSCPSVQHRFPSPPVFKPQSSSRASSRPASPRTVIRAVDKTTEEIIPSVSFRDARSVFCRNEQQNSQPCVPFGSSVLPRQWGESCRGRIPTRGAPETPTRRTQSEQRPRW